MFNTILPVLVTYGYHEKYDSGFFVFLHKLEFENANHWKKFFGIVYICARFSCCYIPSIVMLIRAFLCSYFLSLIFVLLIVFQSYSEVCSISSVKAFLVETFFVKIFLQSFVYISSSSKIIQIMEVA